MGTKYMELDAIKQVTILENLLENLNKLNKNLPGRGRIGMYGHSVGAGNAMHAAIRDSRIRALVLSGTILNTLEVFATISPHFWINYLKMASSPITALAVETHILPLQIPESIFAVLGTLRFVIEESFMYPTAKVAKSINIPTLCIYGENDPTARPEPYKRCFEQINTTEKELRVIPNVNNVFVTPEGKSKASEVLEACVEWMNKSLLEGENE
jgi:pimeloyl-ACP methyl ester carboxylesterase